MEMASNKKVKKDLLEDLQKLIQGRSREIAYSPRDNSIPTTELFGELEADE